MKDYRRKMNVGVIEPGKDMELVTIVDSLENLQELVGGYIEPIYLDSRHILLVNEEGKLKNLPYNFNLNRSTKIVGTVVCICQANDNFTGLGDKDFTFFKEFLSNIGIDTKEPKLAHSYKGKEYDRW